MAAAAAAGFTATAHTLLTPLAGEAVIFLHPAATIDASAPKPNFQIHKGTIGVVRPEATCHECEEVK